MSLPLPPAMRVQAASLHAAMVAFFPGILFLSDFCFGCLEVEDLFCKLRIADHTEKPIAQHIATSTGWLLLPVWPSRKEGLRPGHGRTIYSEKNCSQPCLVHTTPLLSGLTQKDSSERPAQATRVRAFTVSSSSGPVRDCSCFLTQPKARSVSLVPLRQELYVWKRRMSSGASWPSARFTSPPNSLDHNRCSWRKPTPLLPPPTPPY